MISIKINSVCNRACKFCIDKGGYSFSEIDVEKVASEANNLNEYQKVIITGGEPFLNIEEVIKLLKAIRPHKKKIVLNTNGSLLSKKNILQINGLIDELQISIHHYDETENGKVFGSKISFKKIKEALAHKAFTVTVNSTFNKAFKEEERAFAIDKLVDLVNELGGSNLRLTELKMVNYFDFVEAENFLPATDPFSNIPRRELVEKGCTHTFHRNGVNVSVKRLCSFVEDIYMEHFECNCFDDMRGEFVANVITEQTYKVIYGDGKVNDSWIYYHAEN